MSLFQKSVLKSIKLDEKLIAQRWAEYQKYIDKKDYIENVKEEKYQEGFLRDIFENSLGYTLDTTNPNNFNLEREKKNETNSKKADGVIYVDNKVVGVIELKGQDTKNLDKVEAQAFEYLSSHSVAKYVIISNFDELRLYVDKKTDYEEFSLFRLDYEEFKKLHLLLSYESIKEDLPRKLKDKSISFEAEISKKLYKDFSLFRTSLFENLVKNNNLDKALLLRLTQKLCDRIIFILFAEDRGLLTPNTIREIREEFANQKFTNFSLYDIYKFYFNAINEGNEKLNIPKYNGGLFLEDKILDSLIIDDDLLDLKAQALSNYDFMSDISVNILGHIFEQSLTDLEEINASINDTEFDNKKSKRKKDGVFYTPEYITKYIVDNTLGKLCNDKREELNLIELKAPSNRKRLTKKEQAIKENLEEYRAWLLNLKILDPACGSGAFLNQALEFLIKEHTALQKELVVIGDITAYYEIEKSILENNLYGVDINEDAVEIAKLSLWLRTADKGRELTKLADKIKCGNSLIDDKSVVDNAFIWEEEFNEVFEDGGFDIVIGNPPYGAKISKKDFSYFQKYETASYKLDTFSLFMEKATELTKNNGKISLIIPYTWLTIQQHKKLREYILKYNILQIIDLPTKVFEDADLDTTILILDKSNSSNKSIEIGSVSNGIIEIDREIYIKNILENDNLQININLSNMDYKILKKIQNNKKVEDLFEISQGYIPYRRSDLIKEYGEEVANDIVDNRLWHSSEKLSSEYKQEIQGKDLSRYSFQESFQYIKYGKHLAGYINPKFFNSPRILVMEITRGDDYKIKSTFIEKELYNTPSIINIIDSDNNIDKLKYFLSNFNSKLFSWYHLKVNPKANAITSIPKILIGDIRVTPIKDIEVNKREPFVNKVNTMLELTKNLQEAKQNFLNELELEKISKKLQDFEELDFDGFIKEYKKAKKLKFADKLEERNFKNDWKTLFENDSKIVLDLKEEIAIVDKEIDNMVYKLYGLSDDEIKIVEGTEVK